MTPAKTDLTVYQGSTFKKVFHWYTAKKFANGQPVDLTGCTARMQIRPNHLSDVVIHDLTTDGHIMVSSPLDGEISINIPAETTATFSFIRAAYDIEVVFPNGDVFRVIEGNVTLSPEVTR